MKNKFLWASAVTLAVSIASQVESKGLTNGVIVISTRTATDALYRQISSSTLYDADDYKGPGAFAPGDAAMATLLQDHGYVTRLLPEWLLRPDAIDPWGLYTAIPNPEFWYGGGGGATKPADTNYLYSAQLVIISGSGSSADMPPPNTNGIPIIMGEHSCLGQNALSGQSSLFMYANKTSGNFTGTTPGPDQYMLVLQPDHPIMRGIPLDAQGRVKMWRDPYPEEQAHVPDGTAKANYKYSWTQVDIVASTVAPGTSVIGVRAAATNQAVFAVMDKGGTLADTTVVPGPWNGLTAAPARIVHLFVNEHGSGDARRAFNALTDIGRVIFVRTCKWAMGETLTPYVPLGLIQTTMVSPNKIKLEWSGSAKSNYKVLGTANISGADDASNWQTVVQDIAGVDPGVGTTSVKLDISNGPQYAFLRVMPTP